MKQSLFSRFRRLVTNPPSSSSPAQSTGGAATRGTLGSLQPQARPTHQSNNGDNGGATSGGTAAKISSSAVDANEANQLIGRPASAVASQAAVLPAADSITVPVKKTAQSFTTAYASKADAQISSTGSSLGANGTGRSPATVQQTHGVEVIPAAANSTTPTSGSITTITTSPTALNASKASRSRP